MRNVSVNRQCVIVKSEKLINFKENCDKNCNKRKKIQCKRIRKIIEARNAKKVCLKCKFTEKKVLR